MAEQFRWRGREVSRIEAFSDVVFGFSLTLLVVSLEVPRSYDALIATMRGFPAFAVCFVALIYVWHSHHVFFRRYGLSDTHTLVLNTALLFVILFYTYPLKFLFSLLLAGVTGERAQAVTLPQAKTLMQIYGLGIAAVFGILALMYRHAERCAAKLELDELERFDTRESIHRHLVLAAVGLSSVVLATTVHPALAGWWYFTIPIIMTVHGKVMNGRRRRIEERAPARSSI